MTESFPYTLASKALVEFLEKLKTVGVPSKVDQSYLATIGYKSSNHRAFIPILKFADLIDSQGSPTNRYRQGLRGGEGGRRLVADGIKKGYSALFSTYPDANTQSSHTLSTFFSAHSNLGDRALSAAVATFQALCKFGLFDQDDGTDNLINGGSAMNEVAQSNAPVPTATPRGAGNAVNIHVNISLSVDATSDPAVYDAFFAAMAKHIVNLGADGSTDNPA